ncbi:hypothetical protein A2U01_0012786 [Trifolium medium]|uniref:Uncharacterized protein n=1 Tax=Trifolium medium TaxID=97028 RepID=A0A392MXZ2_9FABA|nr:hypothetical protein [Trifolium medium]
MELCLMPLVVRTTETSWSIPESSLLEWARLPSVGQGAFTEPDLFKPTTKGLVENPYSWNRGNPTH